MNPKLPEDWEAVAVAYLVLAFFIVALLVSA